MVLAEIKKNENIVEYVLFMWQMEDLARAIDFDKAGLENFVRSFVPEEGAFIQEMIWFGDLFKSMKSEKLTEKGHLEVVNEIVRELEYLHQMCLTIYREKNYLELFNSVKPHVLSLAAKSKSTDKEIHIMLQGLYGLLILRLKKAPVSEETEMAFRSISLLLSKLAFTYNKMKKGEMNVSLN